MATKNVKFEDKMLELEHIIDELENGNLDLEDSIEKYTKAMKLVNECNEKLNDIESRIAKIIDEDGNESDLEVK
ncbi:MAG: exodeoxyribonuclease VII small subunit [Bacilli bacterium]|nr:exodeoxyribonuclease VII small subunit [Bacilli bacterium]